MQYDRLSQDSQQQLRLLSFSLWFPFEIIFHWRSRGHDPVPLAMTLPFIFALWMVWWLQWLPHVYLCHHCHGPI